MVLIPWTFGELSPNALDLILCHIARLMRISVLELVARFEAGDETLDVEAITSYTGIIGGDVRTKADLLSQATFMRLYLLLLKGLGVRGEENNLRIPCGLIGPHKVVITVDPLDGTARFAELMADLSLPRGGVSIMLAVRVGNEVVAAYVLDLFTGELYRVAPGGDTVVMTIDNDELPQTLPLITPPTSLGDATLLIRRTHQHHQNLMGLIERPPGQPSVFGEIELSNGSIGLSVMQVALGRVAALAGRPGNHSTPWDDTPLVAICRAAGIKTFRIASDGLYEIELDAPTEETVLRKYGTLYVAGRYVTQLLDSVPNVRLLA